jgi:hypothetical protein
MYYETDESLEGKNAFLDKENRTSLNSGEGEALGTKEPGNGAGSMKNIENLLDR